MGAERQKRLARAKGLLRNLSSPFGLITRVRTQRLYPSATF
ncbi:uncharacterized protein G2W53_043920 [Senna tora]|uniref:Uncharacterized protein n=1 Tax=Senna tora TaxID=362788 RepID=A0A834SWH3_9FABA|nr:uncharacterized protein G2W53_043920 [Senna tora]